MSKTKPVNYNKSQDDRVYFTDGISPALGNSNGSSQPKILVNGGGG
jgi:hypothetical protein